MSVEQQQQPLKKALESKSGIAESAAAGYAPQPIEDKTENKQEIKTDKPGEAAPESSSLSAYAPEPDYLPKPDAAIVTLPAVMAASDAAGNSEAESSAAAYAPQPVEDKKESKQAINTDKPGESAPKSSGVSAYAPNVGYVSKPDAAIVALPVLKALSDAATEGIEAKSTAAYAAQPVEDKKESEERKQEIKTESTLAAPPLPRLQSRIRSFEERLFLGSKVIPTGDIQRGKFLGKGAFGKVYLGQWGKRFIAMKEMNLLVAQKNHELDEATAQEVFIWEVARMASVNHPKIVAFYGGYIEKTAEGRHLPYTVMEFCGGGDLDDAIKKNQLSLPQRWQIALEIAQALAWPGENHPLITR